MRKSQWLESAPLTLLSVPDGPNRPNEDHLNLKRELIQSVSNVSNVSSKKVLAWFFDGCLLFSVSSGSNGRYIPCVV